MSAPVFPASDFMLTDSGSNFEGQNHTLATDWCEGEVNSEQTNGQKEQEWEPCVASAVKAWSEKSERSVISYVPDELHVVTLHFRFCRERHPPQKTRSQGHAFVDVDNCAKPVLRTVAAGLSLWEPNGCPDISSLWRWLIYRHDDARKPEREGVRVFVSREGQMPIPQSEFPASGLSLTCRGLSFISPSRELSAWVPGTVIQHRRHGYGAWKKKVEDAVRKQRKEEWNPGDHYAVTLLFRFEKSKRQQEHRQDEREAVLNVGKFVKPVLDAVADGLSTEGKKIDDSRFWTLLIYRHPNPDDQGEEGVRVFVSATKPPVQT